MKILVACFMAMLALSAFGQIEKGKSFITGGLGVGVSNIDNGGTLDDHKASNYNFNAQYGYLIADNWAIGVGASFQGNKQKYDTYSNHLTNASGNVFVRKYFPLGDKFYLNADLTFYGGRTRSYSESNNGTKSGDTKNPSLGISIGPGASYFITDRVALTASLGGISYGQSKYKTQTENNSNSSFGFNFGIDSIILGAALFF